MEQPRRVIWSNKMETPPSPPPALTLAQLAAILDMITPVRSAQAVAEIARFADGVTSRDLQARFGVPLGSLAGILAAVGRAMNQLGIPRDASHYPICFKQGAAGSSRYWMPPGFRAAT